MHKPIMMALSTMAVGMSGIILPATVASAATGDTFYTNCDEARAANAAPIQTGQPGYRLGLDADQDGVACEEDDSGVSTATGTDTGTPTDTAISDPTAPDRVESGLSESQNTTTYLWVGAGALLLGGAAVGVHLNNKSIRNIQS